MDVFFLRTLVKKECETNAKMRWQLEGAKLVRGADVDRYHHDTESEDDRESCYESELESEVEPEDSGEEEVERVKKVYPIAIADDEYTSQFAICENCQVEFDVTKNNVRKCYWHEGKLVPLSCCASDVLTCLLGQKERNYDADIWFNHHEDRDGPMDSLVDDEDYAEGFIWSCCEKDGTNEGCKYTRHKARVNQVVEEPVYSGGLKRKAEDDLAIWLRQGQRAGRCEF